MNTPPIRRPCEIETRPCHGCGKPLTPEQMADEKSRKLAMDETGEFRFIHAWCGINHHTETKKKLAEGWCATCNMPFKDNHRLESGQVPTCRDGREYQKGEPSVSPSREVEAA